MSGFSAQLLGVFMQAPVPEEEGEEEEVDTNPLQPLKIMRAAIKEYKVVVDEDER